MAKQAPLFKLPRRPSTTAATTRAERTKARAWIKAKGLGTWVDRTCCNETATPHHNRGALLPSGNASHPLNAGCLDCIPFPGAPLRNHEGWCTDAESGSDDVKCARCGVSMRNRGGCYSRGGPFCWRCGDPERNEMEAWLLALREDPNAPRPWLNDKAVRP